MSDKMTVILDIDDVCIPWASKVHEECVKAGLTDLPSHTEWQMYKSYVLQDGTPCTLEQWLEVVDAQVVPGGIYHQPPYSGVVDAVERLASAGAEVHFVTARGFFAHSDEIKTWTFEWARKYFRHIPYSLTFAQDKGRVALEIGATHGIDDRIDNVLEMADAGVDAYLMNQPHNVKESWPASRRVGSVSQFVDRILANG
jgi:hypothetical protein